jgi:DNA-binding transcriptional LysR family regulator
LSHGIDSLEQWLDVELFERKARGVILTAAGRQYLPYISTTALFAFKLLLPRLNKFREAYPNMVVTVDASQQIVQLPSDQFAAEPWTGRAPR